MDTFQAVLQEIKEKHAGLFDESALREPAFEELQVETQEIRVPEREELAREADVQQESDLQVEEAGGWWDIAPDLEDFEFDTPRSVEERSQFESGPTRAGVELLAIYLPFHFYPTGHWGIRFFERPMAQFTDRLYKELLRRGMRLTWQRALKIATYAIARHEFLHYLVELEALDLELKGGRRVYRPYWNNVYKRTYAGADCLEETIANVWSWDNSVMNNPARLQKTFRDAIRSTPLKAYARGADLDRVAARRVEDALAAQVLQCNPQPIDPPPVWGSLPRPYVQPWTRYENVSFNMNRSFGGKLGSILMAGPLRKTIRIYHR
jgi:hypothetical protein